MKKIGGTFVFCGVALIIGPLFGFTVRGQGDLDYGSSCLLGFISIAIGLLFNYLGNGVKK